MLERGFWLYVWRIEHPDGEMLYVGRTGDNSSPNAAALYTRMMQHLSPNKKENALRRNLNNRGIEPEDCTAFHLIACGPIYPEISHKDGCDRDVLMEKHKPWRNRVGAMEKALAEDLKNSGYTVLNTVNWKNPYDDEVWKSVREAFAEHFPKLKAQDA